MKVLRGYIEQKIVKILIIWLKMKHIKIADKLLRPNKRLVSKGMIFRETECHRSLVPIIAEIYCESKSTRKIFNRLCRWSDPIPDKKLTKPKQAALLQESAQ